MPEGDVTFEEAIAFAVQPKITLAKSVLEHLEAKLETQAELLDAFAPTGLPIYAEMETTMDMFERKYSLSQAASDMLRERLQR